MQLHCKTLIPNPSPSKFQFPTKTTKHPNTISLISHLPIHLHPTSFSSLKAQATVNNGNPTKPISEMSFYELLGIPQTVSLTEIKHAYKQLARTYHPDVSPPELVQEYTHRFIRVQEAYETLSDPRMRAMYDRDMARGLHLAFSARKKIFQQNDQDVEDKGDWRVRWKSQVSDLKKRSMYKDAKQNSWGARMRRQRNESSS